jgi:hypothetical protein
MYRIGFCVFLVALASVPAQVNGQTDFFFSFQGLNQGASNTSVAGEFEPGDTGTLFIYYTTNGPANSDIRTGAFLDVATAQSGVIRFTSASTLNFNISLLGIPSGVRWDVFGPPVSVGDNFINELGAFILFAGMGIREANNGSLGLLDAGYDAGADAFLFAQLNFEVLPDAAGSSVDLMLTAGAGGIVNQGMVNATFGSATIMVPEDIILGDLNGDGVVSMDDIQPFIQALIKGVYIAEADINQDGRVSLLDVRPFVKLL